MDEKMQNTLQEYELIKKELGELFHNCDYEFILNSLTSFQGHILLIFLKQGISLEEVFKSIENATDALKKSLTIMNEHMETFHEEER